MSDIAIRVENLSKRYRIGAKQEPYKTLRDTLAGAVSAPLRRVGQTFKRANRQTLERPDDFWALKDVSFDVKRGEVVGIIGRNGAGKSTLLKILSRITEPTSGYADVYGRVGSLLEVGTGFHPELTGRENIYLNGAILGMKRAEIDRQFDAIVEFAEIEQFVDTPVKHYSSGMYLRLAFAVAAHLDPEILLVDEVLAVGDAAFQKKCLGKMGEVAKEGRTVFLVSHNIGAIRSLCSKGVLLDKGTLILHEEIDRVTDHYMLSFTSKDDKKGDFHRPRKDCTSRVRIESICLEIPKSFNDHFAIDINYTSSVAVDKFSVEWFINDIYGQRIMSGLSGLKEGVWFAPGKRGYGNIRSEIKEWKLPGGKYSISVMLTIPFIECMDYIENAANFIVPDMTPGKSGFVYDRNYGLVVPEVNWQADDGTVTVELK